ncbi:clavesin-2-like isoform X2 [Anthonomus grandis grandis]|uniref:clavesin-2-like isoform X2 n=1 Tax=Anthonomus grandis grandis TaxID=2921223 RepID=UPI00216675B3|nr:clavesin-2-like isoform X2 [Anthonomus grandis grandis]
MVCKKSVNSLLEPPTPKQLKHILLDNNEISEEKLKHNESIINEWVSCQAHFPENIDKRFIRNILRGCKHSVEKTKQRLEQHLIARHMYPEVYSNRSPFSKDIVQAMDVINIAVMPKLTESGHRLFALSLNRFDPSEFSFVSGVKLFFMLYELMMASDIIYSGDIAIFDAANCTTSHLTKVFGTFLRTTTMLLKEAYAIRLKGVYVVNAPSVIAKMMAAIKPIVHAKVRNSIYIHEDSRHVLDRFGPEYLPSTFGGTLKPLREITSDCYDVLNDNADWFEGQNSVKITRPPKKVQKRLLLEDLDLGLEGSFRKLEID